MFRNIKIQELPFYFYFGVKWNAFEVVTFQLILLMHQSLLFYVCKDVTYGLIATVFSFIYFNIAVLNFGLDKSLITFYRSIIESKHSFRKFFVAQVLFQIFIVAFFSLLFFFALKLIGVSIKYLRLTDMILIFFILITESLRKTLRIFAQLSFLNNKTAILEVFSVIVYVSIFWSLYYLNSCAGLTITLFPLLAESLISLSVLLFIVRNVYNKLIPSLKQKNELSFKEIFFNRLYIFLTNLSTLIFSGNLMLITISLIYGLKIAATLQITKSIITFLYLFIEKTFGITSGSLFTRIKDKSIDVIQNNYTLSVNSVYSSICLTLIFISSVSLLITFVPAFSNLNFGNNFLFMLAMLSNTIFIPQEQLLIVKNKIYYLMFGNITIALIYYMLLPILSLRVLLCIFLILRFLLLKIIIVLIEKNLKVQTLFKTSYALTTFLFVLITYIFMIK